MRKFFIVLNFVGFLSNVQSQVIIQQSSLPMPGDTFAYVVDLNPNVTFNYAQQNALWNLSSLENDTMSFASYGFTSQLPFASSFPGSNLYTYGPGFLYGGLGGGAPYQSNYGYLLFASNSEGFYVVGFRGDFGMGMTNVLVQPHEILMKVPFTYQDSVYQETSWEIAINHVPTDQDTIYKRFIFKTLVAKGWGTLITPYGTFEQCLAVEENMRYFDTLYIKVGNMVVYKTLAQADSVFKVHVWSQNKVNTLLTAIFDSQAKTITSIAYLNYEDLYNNIKEIPTLQVSIFPNPLVPGQTCHFSLPVDRVILTDIMGNVIYDGKCTKAQFQVPENITGGSYFVRGFKGDNLLFVRPIMVVKN